MTARFVYILAPTFQRIFWIVGKVMGLTAALRWSQRLVAAAPQSSPQWWHRLDEPAVASTIHRSYTFIWAHDMQILTSFLTSPSKYKPINKLPHVWSSCNDLPAPDVKTQILNIQTDLRRKSKVKFIQAGYYVCWILMAVSSLPLRWNQVFGCRWSLEENLSWRLWRRHTERWKSQAMSSNKLVWRQDSILLLLSLAG